LSISPKHPYIALFLGLIGFAFIAVAIFNSALLQAKSLRYFTDLKAPKWLSKLINWIRN